MAGMDRSMTREPDQVGERAAQACVQARVGLVEKQGVAVGEEQAAEDHPVAWPPDRRAVFPAPELVSAERSLSLPARRCGCKPLGRWP